jgi:hypothetical protein
MELEIMQTKEISKNELRNNERSSYKCIEVEKRLT